MIFRSIDLGDFFIISRIWHLIITCAKTPYDARHIEFSIHYLGLFLFCFRCFSVSNSNSNSNVRSAFTGVETNSQNENRHFHSNTHTHTNKKMPDERSRAQWNLIDFMWIGVAVAYCVMWLGQSQRRSGQFTPVNLFGFCVVDPIVTGCFFENDEILKMRFTLKAACTRKSNSFAVRSWLNFTRDGSIRANIQYLSLRLCPAAESLEWVLGKKLNCRKEKKCDCEKFVQNKNWFLALVGLFVSNYYYYFFINERQIRSRTCSISWSGISVFPHFIPYFRSNKALNNFALYNFNRGQSESLQIGYGGWYGHNPHTVNCTQYAVCNYANIFARRKEKS